MPVARRPSNINHAVTVLAAIILASGTVGGAFVAGMVAPRPGTAVTVAPRAACDGVSRVTVRFEGATGEQRAQALLPAIKALGCPTPELKPAEIDWPRTSQVRALNAADLDAGLVLAAALFAPTDADYSVIFVAKGYRNPTPGTLEIWLGN